MIDPRHTIASAIRYFGSGGHPDPKPDDSLRFFERAYVLECLAKAAAFVAARPEPPKLDEVDRALARKTDPAPPASNEELRRQLDEAKAFVASSGLWPIPPAPVDCPDCAATPAAKRRTGRGGRPRRRLP